MAKPAPIKGWIPEYDEHIQSEMAKATTLLGVASNRMAKLCPKWGSMNEDQRKTFYADLLFAIAGPESAWDRSTMYNETGITNNGSQDIDRVTKKPICSEGLLQLSYVDMLTYPAKDGFSCAFDFTMDKDAFEEDFALFRKTGKKTVHAAHNERTILDPYIHLSCGLHIMNSLVQKMPRADIVFVYGKYWSTMRGGASAVIQNLKKRKSACF